MRIPCPLCGSRDRREFYYYGDQAYLDRPADGADLEAWDDYLHNRDNPAGWIEDLWYHDMGCAQWLRVRRNTVSHEVAGAMLVIDGTSPDAAPSTAPAKPRAVRSKRVAS